MWVLSSVHSRQMAAQPEVDVVTTADWEWNYYHDYSLRVKSLPPVYATKNRRLRCSLKEMLQSCTKVQIESVRTTEKHCRPTRSTAMPSHLSAPRRTATSSSPTCP